MNLANDVFRRDRTLDPEIARIFIASDPRRLGLHHNAGSMKIHRYPAKSQILAFSATQKVPTTFYMTKFKLHTYKTTVDLKHI